MMFLGVLYIFIREMEETIKTLVPKKKMGSLDGEERGRTGVGENRARVSKY